MRYLSVKDLGVPELKPDASKEVVASDANSAGEVKPEDEVVGPSRAAKKKITTGKQTEESSGPCEESMVPAYRKPPTTYDEALKMVLNCLEIKTQAELDEETRLKVAKLCENEGELDRFLRKHLNSMIKRQPQLPPVEKKAVLKVDQGQLEQWLNAVKPKVRINEHLIMINQRMTRGEESGIKLEDLLSSPGQLLAILVHSYLEIKKELDRRANSADHRKKIRHE